MPATTPERLKRHLADLGKKYPDIWRQVDEFRSGRGKSLPLWSEWCFLPLAAGVAIVTDGAKLSEIHPANFGCLGWYCDLAETSFNGEPPKWLFSFVPTIK